MITGRLVSGARRRVAQAAPTALAGRRRMCKMLLIDDTPEQRTLFSKVFSRDDVTITTVNAIEGDRADWRGYDIVLVDMLMPRFDGRELIHRQVRRYGNWTLPPIVLFSVLSEIELQKIVSQIKRETGLITVYTVSKAAAIGQIMQDIGALVDVTITTGNAQPKTRPI